MGQKREEQFSKPGVPKFGMRHIQVILMFFLLAIASGMRIQLSIAIVAMNNNLTSSNPDIPTFNWSNKSIVLSAFYWGYLTLQLVAGSLAKIYGAKIFLILSMTINAIVCSLIPLAAVSYGSYGVIVCRILQGISQGFFYPSIYNLLGSWAPVSERSRLGSVVLAGYSFGSIFGQIISGYLASSWYGWPSSFYLYGSFGIIWTVLWIMFGASSPAHHKYILTSERDYIQESLGTNQKEEEPTNIPWKAIFTSGPVWALAIYNIGTSFGSNAITTETPIYMDKILGFGIEGNSILSSISSFACFVACFVFGQLADFCINNGYFTRGANRKLFCTIHCLLSVFGLTILCLLPSGSQMWSVLMFVLIGFSYGASNGGPGVNQIDLSPRYAGIILAITNSCSAISSFLGPLAVQVIVVDESDKSQWKMFFYTAIAVYLLANVAFVVCGSGELQPWDSYGTEKSTMDHESDENKKALKKSEKNENCDEENPEHQVFFPTDA